MVEYWIAQIGANVEELEVVQVEPRRTTRQYRRYGSTNWFMVDEEENNIKLIRKVL